MTYSLTGETDMKQKLIIYWITMILNPNSVYSIGKNMRYLVNILYSLFCALFLLLLFGCDSTEPVDENFELNPKLHSVFYWGYSGPGDKAPNVGQSVGPPILNAIWKSSDQINFTTTFLDENDILRKGIFEIKIRDYFSLVNNEYHIYEYEYEILDMSYVGSTNEFLLLVYKDGSFEAITAKLQADKVVEEKVLVDNSWDVEGITIWNKEDGFIFYGRNPQTSIAGFYGLTNNSAEVELIYSIEDTGVDGVNFITSYDGKTLYFGLNTSSQKYYGSMQLLKLSLIEEGAMPVVIFEREGGYIDIAQNPIDQSLFLINYYDGYAPQGHIELFNSATSESIDLDVRTITSKYVFITNESPSWSPDGNHFVFSAGGFSGEGATYYPDLWIYKNVP